MLLVAITVAVVAVPRTVSAQSSAVYATLCGSTSQVTIAQPANDSTLTSSDILLNGTVSQANQIEVYVDDAFDSAIPLTIGQSTYSATVQLPSGTHTLRVEAINSCGGQNGEAVSVVTYTPPPAQASTGDGATTQVAPTQGGAVTIGASPTVTHGTTDAHQESAMPLGLPPVFGRPLEQAFDWLNITDHGQESGVTGLSIGRAFFIVFGMYLLVLGVAPVAVDIVSGLSAFVAATPQASLGRRRQLVRWAVRGGGLLILLLALFL